MAVFATGDIHGDITRLIISKPNIGGYILNQEEENVLFIAGDFGVIFSNVPTPMEKRILNTLANLPYIIMIVDGNHENHPRLYELPEATIFNGKVGVIREGKVFCCRRGEIYTIQGKKFFTFGGATSIDRSLRIPEVSWWKEEVPSPAEMDHGLQMLEDHQYNVDYIIAHTAPEDIAKKLIERFRSFYNDPDPTRKYLEHVCKSVTFEKFYCGHWHVNDIIDRYNFLYEEVVKIL